VTEVAARPDVGVRTSDGIWAEGEVTMDVAEVVCVVNVVLVSIDVVTSELVSDVEDSVVSVVVVSVDVVMADVVVSDVVDDSVVVVVLVVVLGGVPIVIDHAVASPFPKKSAITVTSWTPGSVNSTVP